MLFGCVSEVISMLSNASLIALEVIESFYLCFLVLDFIKFIYKLCSYHMNTLIKLVYHM
jgi:hypothetical protein